MTDEILWADADWTALARFFTNELTFEERVRIDQWLDAHPARRMAFGDVEKVWIAQVRKERRWDGKALWAALQKELQQAQGARDNRIVIGRHSTAPSFGRKTWPAIAAICSFVVLLLGWSVGLRVFSRSDTRSTVAYTTYATGNGQRATITLPDGGTVALNVASRLEVPLDYMSGNHAVRIVGEGLFTVAQHARIPLTVFAGKTSARVLGTSFMVRRYATDTATVVAVRDGKVAVGADVVAANQSIEIDGMHLLRRRSADSTEFSFAKGILTLNGALLPEAIVELNRWYDTDIKLGDALLAKRHIKGQFAAGSLGELVEILQLTYDVRVVRNGRVLTLYSQ